MKNILLILLLCTLFNSCQPVKKFAFISADASNLLLAGFDNPVTITLYGYKPKDVSITIDGAGTFKPDSNNVGTYLIKPDISARSLKLEVFEKKSHANITSLMFRVRKLPPPELFFGTKSGGIISKGELPLVSEITAKCREWFLVSNVSYKVISYNFAFLPHSGQEYTEKVSGNKISEPIKTLLSNAKSGDMIFVTDINVSGPYGISTGDIWLVIK
jgi:hypothetical protein